MLGPNNINRSKTTLLKKKKKESTYIWQQTNLFFCPFLAYTSQQPQIILVSKYEASSHPPPQCYPTHNSTITYYVQE